MMVEPSIRIWKLGDVMKPIDRRDRLGLVNTPVDRRASPFPFGLAHCTKVQYTVGYVFAEWGAMIARLPVITALCDIVYFDEWRSVYGS